MNASTFIKVALLDQMQQIADLGLWYHVAKLLPSGFEVLARVTYCGEQWWKDEWRVGEEFALSLAVQKFYRNTLPEYHHYPTSKDFYSAGPIANSTKMFVWLTSEDGDADKHLELIARDESVVSSHYPPPQVFIHVPQWFDDFKAACKIVLDEIESGELQDIQIFSTKDE